MIDCVNSYKREGDWTPLQRRELANEVLKRLDVLHPDPKRTTQIVRRIETLGENWSTRQHTLALFRYGWDVLINEHSREALMSNPEAVRIKRKSLHPAPEENPPGHRRRTCQATPSKFCSLFPEIQGKKAVGLVITVASTSTLIFAT